jgi:hypothetical protein
MTTRRSQALRLGIGASIVAALSVAAAPTWAGKLPAPPWFTWTTVVNNNDPMPGAPGGRTFNSFNQPSVNVNGLVVIRARSRGGPPLGQPTHGIYTRDMSAPGNPVVRILDRTTVVPEPNNLETVFVETPSFPRIDMWSDTIATRGNHQPVWEYGVDQDHTRAGTTGIYTNPFGALITGASKLGAAPGFGFFAVSGLGPLDRPTVFDVFPGAPTVTDGTTIVFKGNYTVAGVGRTGVFYRDLEPQSMIHRDGAGALALPGGESPAVLIANNTGTLIPGTGQVFGSTSPPSAANGKVVFAGFDNEEKPTLGGLYLAPLMETPALTTLVSIGGRVPGESVRNTFNGLGEGGAFDGRYVGFWGSWGTKTRTVRLYCPTEGNKDRIDYCNRNLKCEDGTTTEEDENSICGDESDPNFGIRCYQEKQVPVNQGIFVHDTEKGSTRTVAKSGARFDEFLFWNYSGKTPCVGSGGHGQEGAEEDGEPARWRSSAFVAVSGLHTAFKAVTGDVVGVYLNRQPGQDVVTVLDTRTDGQAVDPEAPDRSKITELGLEREGLRGDWLVVNAKMGSEGGSEEDGMAGIYLTRVPK